MAKVFTFDQQRRRLPFMELSQYALALVAGGFGIAGALLGAVCTYRLSLRLVEKQFEHSKDISKLDAWHNAANEFIAAFAMDLETLESGNVTGDLVDFLRSGYADHQRNALAKFSHYIAPSRQAAFRSDWWRYCYGTEIDGEPLRLDDMGMPRDNALFLHCYPSPSFGSANDPLGYAARHIRALIRYATDT
jgi:hypothetical protein